jgi:hypothetical protein
MVVQRQRHGRVSENSSVGLGTTSMTEIARIAAGRRAKSGDGNADFAVYLGRRARTRMDRRSCPSQNYPGARIEHR